MSAAALSPSLKLSLTPADGKPIPADVAGLLVTAGGCGSMGLAAKDAGHSYSYVWDGKRRLAEAVGTPLVAGTPGGARDTSLTPAGRAICTAIADWSREVESYARRAWDASVAPVVCAAAQQAPEPSRAYGIALDGHICSNDSLEGDANHGKR